AQALLNPPWPAVDRLVLGTLVATQLLLALRAVVPGAAGELLRLEDLALGDPAGRALLGDSAWLWLGLVLAALLASLWERLAGPDVGGLIVLAVTGVLLTAGSFAGEGASNLALRWGLALCYLAGSVLLWLRVPLARLAGRLGIP